jgi:hypothetical protein
LGILGIEVLQLPALQKLNLGVWERANLGVILLSVPEELDLVPNLLRARPAE